METSEHTRKTLSAAYQTLVPFEQTLVQLASVIYEPVTRMTFANCLRRARITGTRGEWLTSATITPYLQNLQDLGLLNKQLCCPDEFIELASREAVASGSYAVMADAVQNEIPFSQYQGKWPQRCRRAMREYRIGLYLQDIVHLENVQQLLEKQCADFIDRNFPAVRVVINPFQVDFFRSLPPSLQFHALDQVISYSMHYLIHVEEMADYLQYDTAMKKIDPQERLPFQRLLAGYLLLRGELDQVQSLIRENPESFVASGIEGSIDFMLGNNAPALERFESDLKQLKRIVGRRKIYFPNIAGLFFILALLKSGDMNQFYRIRKFIDTVHSQQPGNMLLPVYKLLGNFLSAQEKGILEIKSGHQGGDRSSAIARLFGALVHYWLQDGLSASPASDAASELLLLLSRARDNGFQWMAMEFAELLARTGHHPEPAKFAAQIRRQTGLASIADAVLLEEPWKRRLKALISVTAKSEDQVEKQSNSSRLIWLVGHHHGSVGVAAREQRVTVQGAWSKGRPMALSRLYSGRNLDFLTEQDRRICKAVRREQSNQNVSYRIDLQHALPDMVGHPLLFLEESPDIPVEFVKGEPELLVEKDDGQLQIRLLKDISDEGVTVIRETGTRFKIIEVTDKHRNIARIVSRQGLLVPDSASEKVMEALSNISSFMTVHSAIAVDTSTVNGGGDNKDLIGEVAAQPQVYVQLIPLGEGFRLALFVKPFGPQGPYMKPGQGAENVMAPVGGQRLQTRRDLDLEEKKAQELESLCPTLADLEQTGREWLLQETDICLQVLLELQEARDEIIVEWPEGVRIAVRSVGSIENLKMRIQGKPRRHGLSWFEMSGELELDEALVLDMKRLVELARKNPGRFLPLGDGEFLALTDEFRRRLDDIAFFTEMGCDKDPAGQKLVVHPLAAMALEDIIENIETDQAWQEQLQLIREAQLLNPKVPSTLQAELRDYQIEGYKWLSRLAYWGGGACLADDMGLGKTLQALAIILEKTEDGPILVVAPTSVCMNWLHEANRFAPTLNTHLLGSRNRRTMVQGLKQFDVLVTSYTLLQQEAKLLAGVDWQIIVLDEAQAIKNMETKRSRAAMSLKGKFKLLTTGTPIENNLGELWNLFNFIIPGLLGSLQSFNQRFAIPIERFGDQVARRKLKKLISPFILRRNKSQVLEELPSRTEIVLQVEMNNEESAFYEALRRQALDNLHVAAPAVAGRPAHSPLPDVRNKRNNGKGYTVKILAEIMKLRRACCNPRLVMPDTTVESSKLFLFGKVVDELLENRHKALVFSQFVGHLNIIRAFLDNKGIEYRYLDGATPMKVRKQEVDAFQAGRGDLFLISLKAGGLGLNLTAADYVIHMDPWWNPAVEDQASDRVHRIGQKHPVTIYRLIIKHTIEEKIVNLHKEKRDLANSLLADTDISSRISVEDLLNLIREQ